MFISRDMLYVLIESRIPFISFYKEDVIVHISTVRKLYLNYMFTYQKTI
jgi:hypothetical protein